tara:strand:+ start:1630 stop:2025 length:396 start_codon:yes stop_codon:yes gene_type:complete
MKQYEYGQKIMYFDRNTNSYKRGTVYTQPVSYYYGRRTLKDPIIVDGHNQKYSIENFKLQTRRSNNIIDFNEYRQKLVSNTQLQKKKLLKLKNSIANITEIKNLPSGVRNQILKKINRKLVMVQNLRPFNN